MRLIDSDALFVDDVQGWQFVSKTTIDAAPIVSCAKCAYYIGTYDEERDYEVCSMCYCADHFERKPT